MSVFRSGDLALYRGHIYIWLGGQWNPWSCLYTHGGAPARLGLGRRGRHPDFPSARFYVQDEAAFRLAGGRIDADPWPEPSPKMVVHKLLMSSLYGKMSGREVR